MKEIDDRLTIRALRAEDCEMISKAFKQQGWEKPVSQYKEYLEFQEEQKRDILIAVSDNEFAGYLTIDWESDYFPFQERTIPEIVDLNVLKKYQRQGVGTALMDEAERRIKKVSCYAGIGFGVTKDYGVAQIIYIKRDYIPDGNGIIINSKSVKHGDKIRVDDNVAIYLTKEL